MKTFFGTLLHRLYTANIEHLIWFGAVVVIMIILGVLHHRWKGDDKKKRLWRMLCLLPSVIAAFHAFIYLRGCSEFLSGYFPLYIVALSALLPSSTSETSIPVAISRPAYCAILFVS